MVAAKKETEPYNHPSSFLMTTPNHVAIIMDGKASRWASDQFASNVWTSYGG